MYRIVSLLMMLSIGFSCFAMDDGRQIREFQGIVDSRVPEILPVQLKKQFEKDIDPVILKNLKDRLGLDDITKRLTLIESQPKTVSSQNNNQELATFRQEISTLKQQVTRQSKEISELKSAKPKKNRSLCKKVFIYAALGIVIVNQCYLIYIDTHTHEHQVNI